MHSFIPSAIRRLRNQRRLTLENVSGIAKAAAQVPRPTRDSKLYRQPAMEP